MLSPFRCQKWSSATSTTLCGGAVHVFTTCGGGRDDPAACKSFQRVWAGLFEWNTSSLSTNRAVPQPAYLRTKSDHSVVLAEAPQRRPSRKKTISGAETSDHSHVAVGQAERSRWCRYSISEPGQASTGRRSARHFGRRKQPPGPRLDQPAAASRVFGVLTWGEDARFWPGWFCAKSR